MEQYDKCSTEKGNTPPILVYLAYKFSRNPTENTKEARDMAIALMKKHPDWLIICPHYAVDALLDGTVNWDGMNENDFGEWRRNQAGLMAAGLMSRCNIVVLGCPPTYEESSGVTWEHIIIQLLNNSWKRNDQIKIMTYEEAMK